MAGGREYYVLYPVGIIRHNYDDDYIRNCLEGVDGYIEIYPEYADGLKEIEGFSHLILITYLHKTGPEHRRVLVIRHRKLARLGIDISDIPSIGVFASDSPHRPNPIGLSIVELLERRDNRLHVRGLDVFDGTPVLDIKPYTPDRMVSNPRVPRWYKVLEERVLEKYGLRGPI
jgi:tRNA-Thr(GGU) m(6)t(6)A37 methyltransferase TsaA